MIGTRHTSFYPIAVKDDLRDRGCQHTLERHTKPHSALVESCTLFLLYP